MMYPWYFYVSFPLFLLGILGNLLIIIYFTKVNTKNLKKMSSHQFLIIMLAFTDLFVCIAAPFSWYYSEDFGLRVTSFMCHFRIVSVRISPMFSVWILVLVSFERYRNISHPFQKRIKKRSFFIVYASTLILVSAIYIYPSFLMKFDNGKCWLEPNSDLLLFMCFEFLPDCVLPPVCMVYFYKKICRTINEPGDGLRVPNSTVLQPHQERNRTAKNTLKWLIIIYFCCIVPGRLIELIRTFLIYYNHNLWWLSFDIAFIMRFVNNVINGVVYESIIKGFRRFLLQFVTLSLLSKY